mmetsp:Transcript_87780/g.246638  ORF Transcript_87780/g.246638 Transcript_87780/m.246638 type:complete len:256 (+) Transcript_87780:879-1646(+)
MHGLLVHATPAPAEGQVGAGQNQHNRGVRADVQAEGNGSRGQAAAPKACRADGGAKEEMVDVLERMREAACENEGVQQVREAHESRAHEVLQAPRCGTSGVSRRRYCTVSLAPIQPEGRLRPKAAGAGARRGVLHGHFPQQHRCSHVDRHYEGEAQQRRRPREPCERKEQQGRVVAGSPGIWRDTAREQKQAFHQPHLRRHRAVKLQVFLNEALRASRVQHVSNQDRNRTSDPHAAKPPPTAATKLRARTAGRLN